MGKDILDLLEQVQRLQSIQDIRNLITTYCQSVDSWDKESFLSIWDKEAVYMVPRGASNGKKEIAEMYDKITSAEQNHHHHVTNSKIEINGNSATGVSDVLYYRLIDGESTYLSGRYYDEFCKSSGKWLIKRREFKPQATISPLFNRV
ncbi:ketosteroid isomerase-like protein [Neobacillus niacini]|uniref:nuclear transport factor 2 family protein n=1 Tax=Neobacillus niacini TaxID=86668 RepID=UPI00285EF642|nr:nuclear transport factor 2 family protein [Neobacillus niacini]MDR7075749.1 ketosteroid isomerase-like protein [Neobacillus niacini]